MSALERKAQRQAARPVKSLAEATYEQLRHSIIRGIIRPNERLIEADLAEEFKVSRTPVRESLQRLAAEGMLAQARRGWVVRELTIDEIREIYEVRMVLEGYAARLASERAPATAIEQIVRLASKPRDVEHVGDMRHDLVDDNDRFHATINAECGNDRLRLLISSNNSYYYNLEVVRLYSQDELVQSAEEHRGIAKAIAARDADSAESLTRRHVAEALEVIESRLR